MIRPTVGVDLATGSDTTAVVVMRYSRGVWTVQKTAINPSPSKLARLWRRAKQNSRRIARKDD